MVQQRRHLLAVAFGAQVGVDVEAHPGKPAAGALRPDRFPAMSALSVHWSGIHPYTGPPTDAMR